jgi:hypothetical protein
VRKAMTLGTLSALTMVLAATLAGCKSGSTSSSSTTSPSTSSTASAPASSAASTPVVSSAAASPPASVPASSPVSSPSLIGSPLVLPSPSLSSTPSPSPSVATAPATAISVTKTRVSQAIVGGEGGMATFDKPTTHGLPASVDAALRAPATNALAAFEKDLKNDPCTDTCTPADYNATFAIGRSDTSVVSGTWTLLTFYPGAANPLTVLVGVTVNATDGAEIAPAQLFANGDLTPLVAVLRPTLETKLKSIGCNDFGTDDYDQATAGTADNYQGVAVTASGLLVGISEEQVAAHACGSFEVPISWSAVRAGLSPIGQALAARTALPTAVSTSTMCTTGVLHISFGAQTKVATSQFQLPVVFTNTASEPCYLQGFPGVDFFGDGGGNLGTVSLVRTPATPQRVTIASGASAHAMLTYLEGPDVCDADGQAWSPAGVNVTPPNSTVTVELFFPGNSVDDCQTGATHPGSYIGPVVAGA